MTVSTDVMFDPASYAGIRLPAVQAQTLPPWCYTSEAFYRAEIEHMFMKVWNFLGRVDRIPNPGNYFTVEYVGVPLVILRDRDGELRAFANTCRHRGARVASGEGNCRAFKCPYHGWVYGLDGRLRGADGMEHTENFERADYGLVPVRIETWGGFIFVNFDDEAGSLIDYLGDFPEEMASYDCENLRLVRRKEFDVLDFNWKIHIENAMEEYHVPVVHGISINLKEVRHGITETEGSWCTIREKHEGTRALLEEDKAQALPRITTLAGSPAEGTHFVCLYPSTMLGMTVDCVWYIELHPKGPHRTAVTVGSCFPKETITRSDFEDKVAYYYKRWDKSITEDNDIAEVQHIGLNSPLARPGRLSHLEPLIPQMAAWWIDWVVDRPANAAA